MRHETDLTSKPAGAAGGARKAASKRPLLAALKAVARHFERPDSDTILVAGLPLEGDLTPDLLIRAAERIGLKAQVVTSRLTDLLPGALPVILTRKDKPPVAVLSRRSDGFYALAGPSGGPAGTVGQDSLAADYAGVAVTFKPVYAPGDVLKGGEETARIAREHWFWGTLKQHRRDYLHIILAASFINLLGLAAPLFMMNVYDRVLPNKAIPTLWVLAIGLMLALAFDFLLKSARARLIDDVGRRIDMKLASALYEKVLNISLSVRPASTGAFVNRVSQYEFIREFFTSSTIALFTDLLFIFIYLLVIWQLAGWVAGFPAAAVLIVIGAGLVLQRAVAKKLTVAQNEASMRQGLLVETVSSIETIKSLRAEGHLLRRWDNYAQSASGTAEEIKSLTSFGVNLSQFIQQLVTVGIIVGGTYAFAEGNISTGALIATVILSSRALAPLSQIAMTLTRARQALLSIKLLDEIMNMADDRIATRSFVNRTVSKGQIEMRGVKFRYPQTERLVLNGMSVSIKPGEKVGIIGRIGSGKTTLARLISGLYFPSEGEVLLDGVDIRQYHPYEVRRAVGLVVQEADLFQGSVKENILIAKPDATDDEVIEAARLAGVDAFVSQHPMGYDMPVGERGSALSGGQRQSIALARVLIEKPNILVLDEPTSSMDIQSERRLLTLLRDAIAPDQTVLIATHRQSMLELVDRLIVIDQGRIAADGKRDDVLKALAGKAQAAAQGRKV